MGLQAKLSISYRSGAMSLADLAGGLEVRFDAHLVLHTDHSFEMVVGDETNNLPTLPRTSGAP